MIFNPAALKEVIGQLESLKTDLDIVGEKLKKRERAEVSLEDEKTEKTEKTKKPEKMGLKFSRAIIQPTTRLRKNVDEAKEAQENPEAQAILDRLNDIFR